MEWATCRRYFQKARVISPTNARPLTPKQSADKSAHSTHEARNVECGDSSPLSNAATCRGPTSKPAFVTPAATSRRIPKR